MSLLQDVAGATDDEASARALSDLAALAAFAQIPHLGAVYTQRLLVALGIRSAPAPWIAEARAALEEMRPELSTLSTRVRAVDVAAFAAWDVAPVKVQGRDDGGPRLSNLGAVFMRGELPPGEAHLGLTPVFIRVPRGDHAERAALATFTSVAASMSLAEPSWQKTLWVGHLRLYVTHFPCLSCVAVMCQFQRRFPGVRLEVGFDVASGVVLEPRDGKSAIP